MYGHSKWSPHNFKLDFGSIQKISWQSVCKSTVSQVLCSKQFLKNMILISLDRSKCTAHSDMLSSIPMEFKNDAEQNFDTYEYPKWAINYSLKTFLKSSTPFVLFISYTSLGGSFLRMAQKWPPTKIKLFSLVSKRLKLKLANLQIMKGTCFNKCWNRRWSFDLPLWKNY